MVGYAGLNHPHNAVSQRPYSGCNVVLLWMKSFDVPRYLTFKQALELGGNVRKGEHGTKVYFVKQLQVQDREKEGETRTIPMLKEYTVKFREFRGHLMIKNQIFKFRGRAQAHEFEII